MRAALGRWDVELIPGVVQTDTISTRVDAPGVSEELMAGGWSKDGAVQEQIDSTVEDALARSRQQLPDGESAEHCDECGEPIPQARRDAIRGVRFCIGCQAERDKRQGPAAGYNRRGSKDSQLR